MNPNTQPSYKPPEDRDRHNMYESKITSFVDGDQMAHLHPNGGPGDAIGGWVADTAFVADTVVVKENAKVSGNAKIFGTVVIENECEIYGDSVIFGSSTIGDGSNKTSIYNNAVVFGTISITSGPVDIYSTTQLDGRAFGRVVISDSVSITDGDDAGDVFGEYTLIAGDKYQDVEYPTGPQIHGTDIAGDGILTLKGKPSVN